MVWFRDLEARPEARLPNGPLYDVDHVCDVFPDVCVVLLLPRHEVSSRSNLEGVLIKKVNLQKLG